MSENLTIRPYARLITMLGDQLIKNDLIALVELIKNSYDADASWVKVSFINFNDDFSLNEKSKIIIEDDGCGMDDEILRKHWLNPATPEKLRRKAIKKTTEKGRIMQGEKGIGRFAVFKLGKSIKIITRRQILENGRDVEKGEGKEYCLTYDFSNYDNDFLSESGKKKDIYLDNLKVTLDIRKPQIIVEGNESLGPITKKRSPHGTRIEIGDLKSVWSVSRVNKIQTEIGKLQPIFTDEQESDFVVRIYKDDKLYEGDNDYKEILNNCLNTKAVLKVTQGEYYSADNTIKFELNGSNYKLSFSDPDISGLSLFRKYFVSPDYHTECGDFNFQFYVFDFDINSENQSKYILNLEEKKVIRNHRIYLYRDGIRVMPYGDPNDDWLRIDIARGTISAGAFLSNDQVVGSVNITQAGNPKLKDKTNREGLIEEGKALEDFINVLQLILRYLRFKPFAQYLISKRKKMEEGFIKRGKPLALIEEAKKEYANDAKVKQFLTKFGESYRKEHNILNARITKTENLAAVGLAVETASHDVVLVSRKALEQLDLLIKELAIGRKISNDESITRLTTVRGGFSMALTQLKDIQLLFPSTKSRTKNIKVKDIIDKVFGLYQRAFKDNNIRYNINSTKNPLIVKTTDAVLLQVFINLFDNALYWLKTVSKDDRIVEIWVDGDEQKLIFSDSGPGIKDDDVPYIFDAFYSGKGEDGRGLGLYIARQLLDRYDYKIDIAEFSRDKKLKGANFIIEFVKED